MGHAPHTPIMLVGTRPTINLKTCVRVKNYSKDRTSFCFMEHRETARSAHRYLLIIISNANSCFYAYCWSRSDQHNRGMGHIAPCRRPVTWGRITAISSRRTRRERLQGAALAGLSPERCPHTALGACAATARNPNKNKFNYGMDPGAPSPG